MEKFLPGFNKQYSIDDKGIIYSNYKYLNNGKIWYRRLPISKWVPKNNNQYHYNSPAVSLKHPIRGLRTFFVNSLMVKVFKIKEPDAYHYYDIILKDGNIYNNSIENIGFKIRTEYGSNYKYYPQPFYDNNNVITHKICGVCGIKKEIKHFNLQTPQKSKWKRTYRNICEQCRASKQWDYIRSDPQRLIRMDEHRKRFETSERGMAWRKQYAKDKHQYDFNNLTPHYVYTSLKLNNEGIYVRDMTNELYMLGKKRIELFRNKQMIKKQPKIKQHESI